MKIIEVTQSYSIKSFLESYFSYFEYELITMQMVNSEVIRTRSLSHIHDLAFIIFVDAESENYIKYVNLKHMIGFTDHQVIWLSTKSGEVKNEPASSSTKTSNRDKSVSTKEMTGHMISSDEDHFKKTRREIISVHDPLKMMQKITECYHFYSELRLSQASQLTIQTIMKSMLGFLGEGILILDADKKIIFMNQVAERISGFSEQNAMEQPFYEIFPLFNAFTQEPLGESLFELSDENPTKGLPYNTILIDRDKNEKYISANVSFLFKSLLRGYFIILRDITRIIVTENSFRSLSKAVEYSPASVIIFNVKSEIEYVNPAFQILTGYSSEEVIGQEIQILTSEETPMDDYLELWNALINGKVWDGTLRNKKKNGETYWEKVHAGPIFNESGVVERFVAINLDHSHEREMTEQIKNERNNMYSLINTAPIGLMLFEDSELFANINNRADELIRNMGITIDHLLQFKALNSDETLREHLMDVVATKNEILQKEYYYKGHNEKEIYLRLGAVPFFASDTESALIAIDDVTSNKLIEKQLEIARDEAKEADKAKSMFLANMSHEIRTPINGIIGMTDITLANKQLSEEDEANLKLVKLSSKNLLQIVNDILDISKLDAGKIDFESIPFNVEMIMHSTLKMFEAKAEAKELEFRIHIDDSAKLMLVGDPYRLQQCVINLVNNAIKFTEIGYVEVLVSAVPLKHLERMVYLEVKVSDTGIGIGDKEKNALFKRFSQVDSSITRQYGGTGLGLAITMSLVQLQKGTIYVDSEKGKGSVFRFQIPYEISYNNEIIEDVQDIGIEEQKHAIEILIVEDELINQLIIKKYLSGHVECMDVASDGNQAIDLIKKKRYDLIFMDIQLPGISGIDVMKVARNVYMDNAVYTPIIAVTANALKGDRELFLQEGFDYYVSKPYDKITLLQSMSKVRTEEFLEFRKGFYSTPITKLIEVIADLDQKIVDAFETKHYNACQSYLSDLRLIVKGLGYETYGQKLLKLQMLLRKEDYETFSTIHKNMHEFKQNLNLSAW